MYKVPSYFCLMSLALVYSANTIHADASDPSDPSDVRVFPATSSPQEPKPTPVASKPPAPIQVVQSPFNAFTGKILKSKVRMRLQPSLDSSILREMNANDLVIVVGEKDNFYAVQPPKDIKGYVFRTFVLDGVIEGSRVNIRLEPDLTAPIIAQMNTGDHVIGTVSVQDKKWMEIAPPPSTRFYIAKDFIEKIGDVSLITTMEKRREEADALIDTATANSQAELAKPFDQINLYYAIQDLNIVVTQYTEFPESVAKAKELISTLHDEYARKKEAHATAKASEPTPVATPIAKLSAPESVKNNPSNETPVTDVATATNLPNTFTPAIMNGKMASWVPIEQTLYEIWAENNPHSSIDDFYHQQSQNGVTLRGIIEPYTRSVRNKPGDYILVNQANHLPIAYIYSTKVNLQEKVGQEASIHVLPRDNHNFAFPAYFVLSVN